MASGLGLDGVHQLGPGWYSNIRPFNLGSHLEFRSSLTLMRRFGERFRVGLSVSHYSNAGTGDHNPGAETVRFLFAIPIVRD
jgi:lipid A 3-O-deacylase